MTIDRTRPTSLAALAIIGLIVAGVGTWIVLNSAFFDIREVRVQGVRNVSEDEILRIAAIRAGSNLIMLDTGEVADRLLGHPWIDQVVVERELPTTAVIRVVERRPGGWVEGPAGFAVVAGDGTILEHASTLPPRLPEIGSSAGTLIPGERVYGLDGPLRVTASMPVGLLRGIASADLEGTDVVLRLRDGGRVRYGPPTEVDAKNRALGAMLRWATGEGIEIRTIDVRTPAAPSLQPRRGAEIFSPIPSA